MTHHELKAILNKLNEDETQKLFEILWATANSHYQKLFALSSMAGSLINHAEHNRLTLEASDFLQTLRSIGENDGYIRPVPPLPIDKKYREPLYEIFKGYINVDRETFMKHFKPIAPSNFDRLICDLDLSSFSAIFLGTKNEGTNTWPEKFKGVGSKDYHIDKNWTFNQIIANHFMSSDKKVIDDGEFNDAKRRRTKEDTMQLISDNFSVFTELWY